MAPPKISVVKTKADVILALSELIGKISNETIATKQSFNIGVSGGSLISLLKEGLPKLTTDFTKWRIFFCDERVVPENNTDSTFGQYKEHLISALNLKEEQFIRIKQGISVEETAVDYSRQVERLVPKENGVPKFDVLLLGMGPDGHTCSLFPGHKLVNETQKFVAAISDSPKPPPERVTLTFPVINNAGYCVFAVVGAEKATMVKRILVDKEDLPATRVNPPKGTVLWIVDEGAGEHIPKSAL